MKSCHEHVLGFLHRSDMQIRIGRAVNSEILFLFPIVTFYCVYIYHRQSNLCPSVSDLFRTYLCCICVRLSLRFNTIRSGNSDSIRSCCISSAITIIIQAISQFTIDLALPIKKFLYLFPDRDQFLKHRNHIHVFDPN